jgi:hypothetical protein
VSLQIGDLVTVVWRDDEAGYAWVVAHGRVSKDWSGAGSGVMVLPVIDIDTDSGRHLRLGAHRCGIDWLRGWYASDSAEVRALLASVRLAS